MAKRVYTRVATHLGEDMADIRDCEYQPGMFKPSVFSFAGSLWSAGQKAPVELRNRGEALYKWNRIVSWNGDIIWQSPDRES